MDNGIIVGSDSIFGMIDDAFVIIVVDRLVADAGRLRSWILRDKGGIAKAWAAGRRDRYLAFRAKTVFDGSHVRNELMFDSCFLYIFLGLDVGLEDGFTWEDDGLNEAGRIVFWPKGAVDLFRIATSVIREAVTISRIRLRI